MIIAVVSPHTQGNGNTLTSMFMGLGLGATNKRVLLTQTRPKADAYFRYLGVEQYEDKTTTPTQLVKLLRAGAIQPEDIADYCKPVGDGLDVFMNNKDNFTEEDMGAFMEFVLDLSTHDYIVCDVNDIETETAQMVMKKADIVVINVTQSVMELERFKGQSEKLMKMCRGKQVIMVCNKYNATAGAEKEIGRMLGMKVTCSTISYNAWVINACNAGRLEELYRTIRGRGYKVVELDKDISRLAARVSKASLKVVKSRQKPKGVSIDGK